MCWYLVKGGQESQGEGTHSRFFERRTSLTLPIPTDTLALCDQKHFRGQRGGIGCWGRSGEGAVTGDIRVKCPVPPPAEEPAVKSAGEKDPELENTG